MLTAKEILEKSLADIEAGKWLTGAMGCIGDECGCAVGLVFKNAGLDEVVLTIENEWGDPLGEVGDERPAYNCAVLGEKPAAVEALHALTKRFKPEVNGGKTFPVFDKNDLMENSDAAAEWFRAAIESL